MSVSHRYQNFGGSKKPNQAQTDVSSEDLEDQKLESFEAGYQAGWDDAIKAQADDKAKISADFGQNLQEMSFTYHEALSKLTASFDPIMRQITDKLLPEIMRTSLGAHIVEELSSMMKTHSAQPVEIVVAPMNVAMIQEIANGAISEPFAVVSEESLGEGQAFVRIGTSEKQIDLDGLLKGVSEAMNAFFYENKQGSKNA
jgi:flagellar assembly protein FliH